MMVQRSKLTKREMYPNRGMMYPNREWCYLTRVSLNEMKNLKQSLANKILTSSETADWA